ncbi:MarR family winged helix-turn-helix transcriptional regulator [Dialister sp.]|uniref:MarR family winged helix-turn-helix transcriptional regulator n=1 Tax=Dialister sp. TaxID=1955814 RepID=UPI003EFC580A
MNAELTRQFLDACHEARRICELLPNLPPHVKPRHIRIINCIYTLREQNRTVRVSDVAEAMNGTMPSITKLVNELCEMGAVKKRQSRNDKRVYTLKLTDLGNHYYELYVRKFQGWLCEQMEDMPEEQVQATVDTIHRVRGILQEARETFGSLE